MQKQYSRNDISNLLDIMAALRDPVTGCPWDLEQDFDTIAPYTVEEAYEVADCIERGAIDELPGELGDLLLQVVFHAQMAAEQQLFSFGDVVERICEKMVRRHPHVFGEESLSTGAEVTASWDRIKRSEQPEETSLLDGITRALPALVRSGKLGRRAASVGFDWEAADQVRSKIGEELAELDAAVCSEGKQRIEAELGDLLFTIANYCRHLEVDAEQALRRANDRFDRRFRRVERQVRQSGNGWQDTESSVLEDYWSNAKAAERD